MKKLLSLLVAVLVLCAATAAQAAKIEICHFPPGNPGNWQTITINDKALPAHQAHGDLVGSCSANCETICDDGNKCTVDVMPNNTQCQCQAQPRPAVNCSDGLACTTDSCDPAQGCQYTAVVCQAPDLCTVSVCSEPGGSCENTPVVCPCNDECNPSTGVCGECSASAITIFGGAGGGTYTSGTSIHVEVRCSAFVTIKWFDAAGVLVSEATDGRCGEFVTGLTPGTSSSQNVLGLWTVRAYSSDDSLLATLTFTVIQ